ncbi:transposable element Tcb1 transposase [Trichonephila clavipes]|nr:transposable element Tcb1 transposase [Trichonephila clavipes]
MWVANWNEVVFTDESRLCLQHHDGRIRVWRHRGERMLNSCVMHHHTGPAPSIMITPQLPHQINFGNGWKLLGLLYPQNPSKSLGINAEACGSDDLQQWWLLWLLILLWQKLKTTSPALCLNDPGTLNDKLKHREGMEGVKDDERSEHHRLLALLKNIEKFSAKSAEQASNNDGAKMKTTVLPHPPALIFLTLELQNISRTGVSFAGRSVDFNLQMKLKIASVGQLKDMVKKGGVVVADAP